MNAYERQASAPLLLRSETIETPIGGLVIAADENNALYLTEFADCQPRIERWLSRYDGSFRLEAGSISSVIEHAFARYFSGDVAALDALAVKFVGSLFHQQVWTALRTVRPGQTLSYGAFARQLGRPKSARAVGYANGANPLSIVVPCHRLVAADGALTKYGGGLARKRWLLDHEKRHIAG
ncbi:methylated-DNA--[protein]-cysteine S-methyltransferase [Manganibacter manganicus]|uniref:methylated-DNA--[protein]-cysteine S-methyltransferase n=1 Tax=Manganibacter manganicus TaxID=1873176 RepID=UPI0009BB6E8B|nr:methylated-DNA--[protein]-cysteine S-methyltransferase [Pseudaminobacter manganicus]